MPNVLNESISKFINPKLIVAASNLTVTDAVKIMIESRVDSILVFEDDEVIGIVTNKDVLFDLVAKGLDPSKIPIKQITHHPLIKIHKNALIKDALELMNKHHIRRLIVTDDKRTVGILSRKKIIGNMRDHTVLLPELDEPNKIRCPYCISEIKDRMSLSKHIDELHIGKKFFDNSPSYND